jgi:hypothetical protein
MLTYQASLHYTIVRSGDTDPLTHPLRLVEYMWGAFADCAREESLWLISMNSKYRPIARMRFRTGPLVGAMTSPRDLFRAALLADANTIAIVLGEPGENVAMTVHDTRALKRFGETARYLSIQFVDYLISALETTSEVRCFVRGMQRAAIITTSGFSPERSAREMPALTTSHVTTRCLVARNSPTSTPWHSNVDGTMSAYFAFAARRIGRLPSITKIFRVVDVPSTSAAMISPGCGCRFSRIAISPSAMCIPIIESPCTRTAQTSPLIPSRLKSTGRISTGCCSVNAGAPAGIEP